MEISLNAVCLLLSTMTLTLEDVIATVTMTQSNSEVIVGETTRMSCVTSLPKEIFWRHVPAGSPAHEPKEVYAFGNMHPSYRDRCEMQINRTTGFYQLVIPRVELIDAGLYTCQEDEGIGNSSQAELTVLEADPVCASTKNPIELIGPNSCNKEQENLTLSCSVAYRGNSPPLLEWKMVGADDTVTQGVTIERLDNRITSHLKMPSQPSIDESRFICQTAETKYNCTSDVINVIYAISSNFTQKALIGETVVCTANTSESCSYRWKWFKGDDILTVSNSRTLIPDKLGNFRCEADCFIMNDPCTITAMFAYVDDGNATSATGETNKAGLIAGLIVCVSLVIVAIISILIVVWKKRNYNENQHKDGKVQVPLQTTPKEDRNTDVVDWIDPDEYDIQKAFYKHPYIGKGLNGEIRGPGQYKGINALCAFERIMYSTDQRAASELQMTNQRKLSSSGQQWKELDHDNLLKFYYIVLKHPAVFIVKEYAVGGSVRNALKKCTESKVNLQISVVKDWATQIANGMNHLHDKSIIHKSLKCAQVLIMEPFDPSKPASVTLKISNNSLSSDIDKSNPQTFQVMFAWMAPEAISKLNYSIYSDIWSYGVTVWEILTTEIPFKSYGTGQIIQGISNGTLSLKTPDTCPQDLHDIIKECFDLQPERRPEFSKILTQLREEN